MSESEESSHPWERYYAAQGRERPPQLRVTRTGATVAPFGPEAGNSAKPGVRDIAPTRDTVEPFTPAVAVQPTVPRSATDAVEKINWHEVPLVELIDAATQQRLEEAAETKRVREAMSLLRWFSLVVGIVVAGVLGFEGLQFLVNDRPRDAELRAAAEAVGRAVLRQQETPGQPLALQSASPAFAGTPGRGRADYDVVVTLELRAPLYAEADSNGAQAYLQLQRAVADAHARVLASPALRARAELLAPPELPVLVAQTHRSGERLVIRVPLEARRRGLRWELTPHLEQWRMPIKNFAGETLDRLPPVHVLFGTAAGREEMRRLMAEARQFIFAAQAAANRRPLSD